MNKFDELMMNMIINNEIIIMEYEQCDDGETILLRLFDFEVLEELVEVSMIFDILVYFFKIVK